MEISLHFNPITQIIARLLLRSNSWKLDVSLPPARKFVLVGAPHTSNLDFLYLLLLRYATGVNLHWIGKDSLFRGPLGRILTRLGGIPVDRGSRNNVVGQIVEEFNRREDFVLVIAPEGTRRKSESWKTGFYYIASGAGVPIVLAYVDYRRKILGTGPTILPSGDIQADFEQIRRFYSGITGKYPAQQGEIKLSAGIKKA